ncbi:hypothetical protein UFOVP1344_27 [uncultured Caudovirales phage]|uniref:Uncharacterized protein n=1 Tax=uncultured Caudovirales phage TaxID=2100421 RepID=A0A6J5RZS3_9CAUD|nr:hypothetical protein UFOVP1005_27 [uncultured Caudovirales phage]CAB4200100.1 hypothetical protein UFOVP1344_27 [uncultured Caudovirales phage]CAB4218155.1 hypothetical protein UFOVP1602_13 [uncultured Caudovirales phage]
MKINSITLTNEDAADIVHCAVEGGTNYWAEVKDYNWKDWYEKDPLRSTPRYDGERIKVDLPDDYVFVWIREDAEQVEPERFSNLWIPLDRKTLEKGVIALIENVPHLIHGVSNRGEGDIEFDFDGTSCDVIVQYAIFGEVIYG